MTRARIVASQVSRILSPHLGEGPGRERANHIAQLWAFEPVTEEAATEIILGARSEVYGGVPVSDVEAASLASRVLLLLDGLG